MSASSTSSSSTSCPEGGEPSGSCKSSDEGESTLKKRMQQYGIASGYANSSISTLDRSQYQSLPLNGTRRVTVQFGRMKIVVPWKESDQTVGQLADAALLRYKKARGMANEDRIHVHRLECASDGGILDMDDVLEEVFDLNYDQILAITDEANGGSTTPTYSQIQKQQHHYAQPLPYARKFDGGPSTPIASAFGSVTVNHQAHRAASPYNVGFARSNSRDFAPQPTHSKERRDSVVEVSSFDQIPQSGLRVSTPKPSRQSEDVIDGKPMNQPILRSSLRTEASGSRTEEATPVKQSRVTLSPEVEKKLAEQDERKSERRKHYDKNPGRFARGSDRKSRITDALLDARDRIADQLESQNPAEETKSQMIRVKIDQGPMPGTSLVTFPPIPEKSENEKQLGIEVNAVFDESSELPGTSEPTKLSSVQIMKIEDGGRIAKDGRIRVGDCIVAIDGKPVDQMSIIRVRASISDLAAVTSRPVTLIINRSLESFLEQESSAKPIQSALQQANTQYIGHTTVVELIKSSNGFGFTVTGRETAKGERLFYIGTVKPYGVALGHLKSGDRLLEINGTPTGQWTQSEIVEKLKETMVGEKIKFLVSRVSQSAIMSTSASSENKENEETLKVVEEEKIPQKLPLPALMTPPVPKDTPALSPSGASRFEIVIPFINGSSSAGLGVSLKARVSKKSNGSKVDCGIFIKNVMHGGAAFKEGGLRVDDRIVGVEDIDLEPLDNREAQAALAKKLKEVGMISSNVRLTISRYNECNPGQISRDLSRITVDASSPSPSSRMSSHTAPDSLLPSPATRGTSSSGADSSHSRQSSASSAVPAVPARLTERDSIVSDGTSRNDESELPDSADPFNREGLGRKSLSEKRGMGAAADPQHIKLFQDIKHQRQNSAPTSSTQKRSKSQPRSSSQRNYRSPMKLVDLPTTAAASASTNSQNLDDSDMLNRRSQSMESINRPVESILRGTGQIPTGSSSKVQFMQAASPDQHPFPPGAALLRLKNEESRSRDKSRRKSMGNAMRNFFGFGSKSRDASPEKTPTESVQLRSVERPKSIIDERNNGSSERAPPPLPPHQSQRRGSGGNVFVDYGEPYGLIPQYPHNTSKIMATSAQNGIRLISYTKNQSSSPPPPPPAGGLSPLQLGNSKFYSSYREPSITQRPRLPDMSRTPTLSSTIDTRPIAITRVGAQSSMKTNTFTDNRVPAVIHRSTRRPMSTMDYQHLMRTMSVPEYHHKPPVEVSRKPVERCVVSIPPNTMKTSPTINKFPNNQRDINRVAVVDVVTPTTITCSTRGSRTLAVEQSAPLRSSSPRTDHRRYGSQPLRPSNEANRSSSSPSVVRRPRPLTVGDGALRVEPLPLDHHQLGSNMPRRRSMRMLDLENSMVDRPDSLFQDTAVGSARLRLQQTSGEKPTRHVVEEPAARRANTVAEIRDRLIVFPSTRFPIAASSMRVSSAAQPLANSVNLRSVSNNKINDNSAERISLRARKKLHREAVTRSEFFLPPSYSNENIKLFNSLLPPSTSSIMTTKTPSPTTPKN